MKSISKYLALLAFSSFLAGVGCDSDTSDNLPNNSSGISIDDLGAQFAEMYCSILYSCCTEAEFATLKIVFPPYATSEAECKTLVQAEDGEALTNGFKESVQAGRRKFDGAEAANCLAKMKTQCLSRDIDGPFRRDAPCEKAFVGLVPTGGDCTDSDECADAGAECLSGKCSTTLPKENESCPESYCTAGLRCEYVNTDTICIKPLADGQPCTDSAMCSNYLCSADPNMGVCIPKKKAGDACGSSGECTDGHYCDGQVCAAEKAGGATCVDHEECASKYCDTGKCIEDLVCDGV